MNILFIGDIFGSAGRGLVARHLADIISEHRVDFAIANAENAAGGFGITPSLADDLFGYGLDVLSGGNHMFDKKEIYEYLNRKQTILRPANYPAELPGSGVAVVRAKNGVDVAAINLQGRVYMPTVTECPFRKADSILAGLPQVKVRIVDFHAEVTSEKVAMGWYLNGRVSAVLGTHTHIPTADTRVLSEGTAYQTDVGMTGPYDSVIGVDKTIVLQKFLTALPARMEAAQGMPELHAVVIDVDESTGKARTIRRVTCLG